MTYGQLKLRMTQMFPSVSLDIIEGFIGDRYAEILGELPWSRQDVQGIVLTSAPYKTGQATVTQGSAAISLSGGTWTSDMSGRAFRVSPRSEFYEFTFIAGTTAGLDRNYEGPSSTTAGYSIFQQVYPLPAACRLLHDDAFSSPFGEMRRTTHGELNQSDPQRVLNGTPRMWASYMDDTSTPPRMQVELYPVPDTAVGIPFTYSADAGELDPSNTSLILQVWMQPAALVEGTIAKLKRHLRDYTGAQLAAVDAAAALKNMRTSEAQGMAPAQMQLDSYYTRHRSKRWCR